jgi:uncharacterized RDD family membrane protein YckC
LIDTVVIIAGWSVILVILLVGSGIAIASASGASAMALGIFAAVAILLSPWLYYVLLTGMTGQTLGKTAVGVKVVRGDSRVAGLGRAALREVAGKPLSAIAVFLGFLSIAWDPAKEGWHDKIAGTRVIMVRRQFGGPAPSSCSAHRPGPGTSQRRDPRGEAGRRTL